MTSLSCLEIAPQSPDCEGTIIWLHGLGANGHDFEPIVRMMKIPGLRFVLPHAPEQPVTLNGGMVMPSWYDIRTLAESPEREDTDDIERTAVDIEALIVREVERGIPNNKIILAGFSQGGAIALHVGLRYPDTLAGIMALSTYLVMPEGAEQRMNVANSQTPILFCHGRQDDVVRFERGQRARDMISTFPLSAGRDIQWHDFEMGHQVCIDEIAIIKRWLMARYDIPTAGE